jgi:hypothetical protein
LDGFHSIFPRVHSRGPIEATMGTVGLQ